ncbi:MAG: DNA-processing protein DprA [bacterium]
MRITENALNILAAKAYKGIGKAWIVKNIDGNDPVERIVELLNRGAKEQYSISVNDFNSRKENIRKKCEELVGCIDGVVGIGDPEFPSYRGVVKNSERPVALFYRGNLTLLKRQNTIAAVIGLLNPDKDTETAESAIVSELVKHGVTILSGLALGCDSIAHKQTLISGGRTIAALPSPVCDIIPAANKALAEEIVQKDGLLISEYMEVAKSKMEMTSRYIERDRLQALFSDCVILAASYSENNVGNDSGARHAMKYAENYSILKGVMYDEKSHSGNPKYDLNRQLISEGDVIVIKSSDLKEMLKSIKSMHDTPLSSEWKQTDLF